MSGVPCGGPVSREGDVRLRPAGRQVWAGAQGEAAVSGVGCGVWGADLHPAVSESLAGV